MKRWSRDFFQTLTRELKEMGALEHSEENYFSLLFDNDLPARVTLLPKKYIMIDFYIEDFFWFKGLPRYAVVEMLMHLNSLGTIGRGFTLSLDNDDVILLSKGVDFDIMPEVLLEEIDYLYRQAKSIREVLAVTSGAAPLSEIFSVVETLEAQEER